MSEQQGNVSFRYRRVDEPYVNFECSVQEDDAAGLVVLVLSNREDDEDATRLGFQPDRAKALSGALTEAIDRLNK